MVIPHGSQWSATPPPAARPGVLITWGLLGPGKGLERSLEAMVELRDLDPSPQYTIVGRTHPVVARNQGVAYRRRIESMVRDLGIDDMVEFVDRYVADDELYEMVRKSHVVVIPYDNTDQVTSGVVTDAIAAGRPVVATRFPHAEELVASGSGIVVDSRQRGPGRRREERWWSRPRSTTVRRDRPQPRAPSSRGPQAPFATPSSSEVSSQVS